MTTSRAGSPSPAGALSIGELAARTGLTPALLRTWEVRHGFPTPRRSPGGHRWYAEDDVDLVARVLRRQRAGVRLGAAIREVIDDAGPSLLSLVAMLRARHPELAPQRLRKATVLGLSRAAEDEYLLGAEPGVLCGAFQREQFYRASASRWSALAAASRWSIAFADFPALAEQRSDRPALVPLPDAAPLLREWAVVAQTTSLSFCLAAWEPPGQVGVPDDRRVFEVVWTLDPVTTRHALRTCLDVAAGAGLVLAQPLPDLEDEPLEGTLAPARAAALFNRALGYTDRALADPS